MKKIKTVKPDVTFNVTPGFYGWQVKEGESQGQYKLADKI